MHLTLLSPYPDLFSFGIRSLSAACKQAGHSTRILFLTQDFNVSYTEMVLKQIVDLCRGSDLVGIGLMTNFWDNTRDLTHTIKSELGIPVIWGGIHPTIRPEECLQYADHVAIGEAEKSLVEFLDMNLAHSVSGIFSRGGNEKIPYPPPADPDSLPPPDYDLDDHWVLEQGNLVRMTPEILATRTAATYLTIPSRGCPFQCSYCCNAFLNRTFPENRKVRHKSMSHLLEEIETVCRELPIWKQIKFDDDAFFSLPLGEIQAFSREYKQRIGLPLVITGITPSTVQREKLQALVEAGLVEVRMGIESASETTRKFYRRPQTEKGVLKAAQLFNEFSGQLKPLYDLIIDNPWESEESLVETLQFVTRLPLPFELILYSLTFYPGTDVYEQARQEGLIKDDLVDVYRKYYHSFQPTYLNELYETLTHYAHWNEPIPIRLFDMATHPWVRRNPLFRKFPALIKNRLKLILKYRHLKQKWGR
jgi:radical SAM superfamily enzyme YgiQ (UPF0313 family)